MLWAEGGTYIIILLIWFPSPPTPPPKWKFLLWPLDSNIYLLLISLWLLVHLRFFHNINNFSVTPMIQDSWFLLLYPIRRFVKLSSMLEVWNIDQVRSCWSITVEKIMSSQYDWAPSSLKIWKEFYQFLSSFLLLRTARPVASPWKGRRLQQRCRRQTSSTALQFDWNIGDWQGDEP